MLQGKLFHLKMVPDSAQLIDGIDLLAINLDLPKTQRTISEVGDEIFPFM
jgi:hypothetical protein